MHDQEEHRLVIQCRSNDQEAQRQLYERYCAKMMGVCMRYARSREEAQDILQDGFIRVFEKLHTFKCEGSLEGWVRRVIVNVALRHVQKNARIHKLADLEEVGAEGAVEIVDSDFAAEDLMRMVQRLPDGYRVVFNLYAIEGYSHQEIAKKLNISEGTSKSQLSRARQHLARQIKRMDDDMQEYAKKNRVGDGTTG